MSGPLAGKVALVTRVRRGIGRACARAFAEAGADVALGHLDDAPEAALGPCDVRLNNAGPNLRASFGAVTEADDDRVMDVHLKAMFVMAQAVHPGMVARGAGRIITIASQLGLQGAPGIVTHCAAKAGIIGFTGALAQEAGPLGVLVNAIAPGPIETDLTRSRGAAERAEVEGRLPLRRLGRVEEVAATALLLAGPGGGYSCGARLSPKRGDVMH